MEKISKIMESDEKLLLQNDWPLSYESSSVKTKAQLFNSNEAAGRCSFVKNGTRTNKRAKIEYLGERANEQN